VTGNLLTLPVGNSLIYIEPYYVQSTDNQGYPTLQDVAVVFGDQAGFAPTLAAALDQVFGAGAGTSRGPAASPTPTGSPAPGGGGAASSDVQALIAQAQSDYAAGRIALARGDLAGYGAAQHKLQQALADLATRAASRSVRPSTSPTPKAPVSPTPSR